MIDDILSSMKECKNSLSHTSQEEKKTLKNFNYNSFISSMSLIEYYNSILYIYTDHVFIHVFVSFNFSRKTIN